MTSISLTEEFFERVESLGDNCEFGFVNRKHGHENGSVFRWASMKPSALLALLINDFRHVYEFENLSPLRAGMVEEDIYKIGWHTSLKSAMENNSLKFIASEEERRRLYKIELKKFSYLVQKFKCRLRSGGIIYFLKCNNGIETSIVDAIHHHLEEMAEGAPFWLVHVRLAQSHETPGDVKNTGERRMEAAISRFASYKTADDLDLEVWDKILQKVSANSHFNGWASAKSKASVMMNSIFLELPIGDIEGTSGSDAYIKIYDNCHLEIENALPWTRPVNHSTLRLHAPVPTENPTIVNWSHLSIKGRATFDFVVNDVVSEGIPVQIFVNCCDEEGNSIAEERILIENGSKHEIELDIPDGIACATIRLECHAALPYPSGVRAVVDIAKPTVTFRPK